MTEIEYRPCKQEHIRYIDPQDGDSRSKLVYLDPDYAYIINDHFSMSAWVGNECMGAAGIITLHKYQGIAWAIVSRKAGPYMLAITRKIKKAIELHPCKRIEMRVIFDFEEGHKWAKLIGFGEPEAPRMRSSGVFGEDETLYARVKP